VRVVVTGGQGFVGRTLADRLQERGTLCGEPVEEVVQFDLPDGDVADRSQVLALLDSGVGAVFHLASIVSGEGEVNFDGALRVNLDGTRNVLEACRSLATRPRVVFASTLAVYGGEGMADTVSDTTRQTPQTTYGTSKAIGELLVNDYTRKGFVDGRSARLPTVIVRPGTPNAAASSFASAVFREPLAGVDYSLPVSLETRMPVIGARTAVECLIHLAELDGAALGDDRALNLPGISVTAAEMVESLQRVAGDRPVGGISVEPDPSVEAIVRTWATVTASERADGLGFPRDESLDAVVREYIEDHLEIGAK
jgi:nucleoside-diphosphate-sugar epimerase